MFSASGSSRPTTPRPSPSPESSHPLKSPAAPTGASFVPAMMHASASSTNLAGLAASTSIIRSRKTTPQIDSDVTRPVLKRLTGAGGSEAGGDGAASGVGTVPAAAAANNRKGKARASLDELSLDNSLAADKEGEEREVLIHTLAKTDTIASISLQYGISPQAIRASNRLWPSDSIHLRKLLHIPLDQCRLQSSRVSDTLVLLDREPDPEPAIVSPTARRAPTVIDLLGLESERSSFDISREDPSFKGKSRAASPPLIDYQASPSLGTSANPSPPPLDAVNHYLRSTHNPYSSPIGSPYASPPSSRPASEDPFNLLTAPAIARKTLPISRVPASSLSFFPPPAPAFSAPPTRPSFEELQSSAYGRRPSTAKGGVGPITKSLSRLGLNTLASQSRRSGSDTGRAEGLGKTVSSSTSSSWLRAWDPTFFGAESEEAGDTLEFQHAATWGRRRSSGRRDVSLPSGWTSSGGQGSRNGNG